MTTAMQTRNLDRNSNRPRTVAILLAAAGIASLALALAASDRAPAASSSAQAAASALPIGIGPAMTPAMAPGEPGDQPAHPPAASSDAVIQIALLLDTSGSMSGLINQARTQLWKIVNQLAEAERKGAKPRLEIALYEYGKPSLGAEGGFIRQAVPLTDDLDRVSEALFALTTDGGDEFAGQVIQTATRSLTWNDREDTLRLVFIAGNESFEQGTVDYRAAIAEARARGIVVNTIYCGAEGDPVLQGWQQGAELAQGQSLIIDHNQVAVHIAAPQDDDIVRLGAQLNDTYIGYTRGWTANVARQTAQDGNAVQNGSMVARSQSKASALYNNPSWDLIDGLDTGAVDWDKLDDSYLPANVRAMSRDQRKAYVAKKRAERQRIEQRIAELGKARDAFVTARRAEMASAGTDSLDTAMIAMIREQAASKGYGFQ